MITRFVCLLLLILGVPGAAGADDAVQFTTHPEPDLYPAWSPDNTLIAFTRGDFLAPRLFTKPVAGGPDLAREPTLSGILHPAFSPDGALLIYSRLGVLWTTPASGGGTTTQITSPLDDGDPDEAPDWAPDGFTIAIQTRMNDESEFTIGTVTHAGGVTQRITTTPGLKMWPDWSPDGMDLVVRSGPLSNGDIHVVTASSGAERPLVSGPTDETHPVWSPDGQLIAYAAFIDGNYDIWVIPAGGGTATRITDDPANDFSPTWSPDGTQIAFTSSRSGNDDIWIIGVGTVATEPTSWSEIKTRF